MLLQTHINFKQVAEDSPPPPKSLFKQTVLALMHRQHTSKLSVVCVLCKQIDLMLFSKPDTHKLVCTLLL